MRTSVAPAGVVMLLALAGSASAQWFNYPRQGTPRTPDGKADLNAPAPKLPDGKPDLSGVWLNDQWSPPGRRPAGPGGRGGGPIPKMLPWAQAEFDRRTASGLKDDPKVHCMPNGTPHAEMEPYPFEIINAPGKVLILYEMYLTRRQIFTDGRQLPKDPNEFTGTWMGYSVGQWEGDEFVVHTTGFNEKVWPLDFAGHPKSDALHVYERFKRVDFGHMDLQITIDDPKTYESKWVQNLRYTLLPDTDLLEFVCEANRDPEHMVGR